MTTTQSMTEETTERASGRHPVEVGYLVMGLALLGMVAAWALIVGDVVEGEDVRWLLPMPWVLAGGAGLIALAVTGHRGRESRQVGWVTPPVEDSVPVADVEPTDDTAPITADSTDTTDTPTTSDTTDEEHR